MSFLRMLSWGLLLVAAPALALPGEIVRPATGAGASVLDPNGDGFVSAAATGFSVGGSDELESELGFHPSSLAEPADDARTLPGGPGELVGPALVRFDPRGPGAGDDVLIVRFRVGADPAAFTGAYHLLVDLDGLDGFERELIVSSSSVELWSLGAAAGAPALVSSAVASERSQVSIALTEASGTPDFLVDAYVPLADVLTDVGEPVRLVAASSADAAPVGSGQLEDAAGADDHLVPDPLTLLLALERAAPHALITSLGDGGGFDFVAPETTFTSTPLPVSSETVATFEFTADDPLAVFECRLDASSGFTACASPFTTGVLANGTHTLLVRGADAAGNVDSTPAQWTWDVDAAAPETTIEARPSGLSARRTATIAFVSSDAAATFECRLDAAAFSPCLSPAVLAELPEGPHAFEVRAIDPGGRIDPSPALVEWVVDTLAPRTSFDTHPPERTKETVAVFSFHADEAAVTFECARDGVRYVACRSPIAFDSLGLGSHVFHVRATDAAGNVEALPATFTWLVFRDADGDGLGDEEELALGLDPHDADSDDDGVPDGLEPNHAGDPDGDGLANALDPDSDDDGLSDGTELGVTSPPAGTDVRRGAFRPDLDPTTLTDPQRADSDGGGARDGSEDANLNGRVDDGESDPGAAGDDASLADTDHDGLSDGLERTIGLRLDDPDSDDDGVVDGAEANAAFDTDGDGIVNALDPDSDDDGLFDGTETGVLVAAAGTDLARGRFIADADPGTRTGPLSYDTDRGGVSDGAEDVNRNGRFDPSEWSAVERGDDPVDDTDGDGLPDLVERRHGTDPSDADTDDDGVRDGQEPGALLDTDGDGLVNALDPDSDDDGLSDGTERGVTVASGATDLARGRFRADLDPSTTTNPRLADTDRGGVADGSEDANRDGRLDPGELDPASPADDAGARDTDGDGLTDACESVLGLDPNDADDDDDGVPDGAEPNFALDMDGDGLIDALDPDSDGDGLFDGTEQGTSVPPAGTDVSKGHFIADADPGTRTAPLAHDTDHGGASDGDEDSDHNGRVDYAERDPRVAADDLEAVPVIDADADGVFDSRDDCPALANPDQADTDRDGRGDACDPDADGDGFIDGVGLGGGCATAPLGLAALVPWLLRRRRRG